MGPTTAPTYTIELTYYPATAANPARVEGRPKKLDLKPDDTLAFKSDQGQVHVKLPMELFSPEIFNSGGHFVVAKEAITEVEKFRYCCDIDGQYPKVNVGDPSQGYPYGDDVQIGH